MKKLLLTVFISGAAIFAAAQTDSFVYDGIYRSYIVHLPPDYSSSNTYALVLNFHGLGSNALEQELYSTMDMVADTGKFIVVYPEGLNNAWNFFTTGSPDDIGFTSALIDTLLDTYSISPGCVFSTGMSNGGFMSFALACNLYSKISAVAPVAGNMTVLTQPTCAPLIGIPLLEIHGTDDAIVPYNGSFGVPTVPQTIDWWVNYNNCDTPAVHASLPDINTSDGCTVETFTYPNGNDNSEVIHYRINGGGHTWPGAIPVVSLGNTCEDFNASSVIWNFFKSHCAAGLYIHEADANVLQAVPNPFNDVVQLNAACEAGNKYMIRVTDIAGRGIEVKTISAGTAIELDFTQQPTGIYFIILSGEKKSFVCKVVKQ